MVKGFLDATAGLQALAKQHETISHNLANVSTDGYHAQRLAFRTLLDHSMVVDKPGGSAEKWIAFEAGRYDVQQPGAIKTTDNPLDFAVEGDGCFAVDTPAGVAYTRDGHFTLDDKGRLTTAAGYAVRMEGGGEIVLPDGADLHVGKDGTLRIGDAVIGRLELVKLPPERQVERLGDNLVKPHSGEVVAGGVNILQGALEDSNVNAISEMVDMIKTSRFFEMISKSLTTTDDTMRIAINDVGRAG